MTGIERGTRRLRKMKTEKKIKKERRKWRGRGRGMLVGMAT